MPIIAAYHGNSCAYCCAMAPSLRHADGTAAANNNLLRCSSCKLAYYCSKECQKLDWIQQHKMECKFLNIFKHSYVQMPGEAWERQKKVNVFLEMLPMMLLEPHMIPIKNPPTVEQFQNQFRRGRFTKFVMYGRACQVCCQNEFSFASSKASASGGRRDLNWTACIDCGFGSCCSKEHWDEYHPQHTDEVCQAYQKATEIELFHYKHVETYGKTFLHIPSDPIEGEEYLPTFPTTWEEYFALRFTGRRDYLLVKQQVPNAFFPAATHLLSQPVTCVSAMYQFGISHFSSIKALSSTRCRC